MSRKRVNYSSSFKPNVALVAFKQDKTIRQLSSLSKVYSMMIAKWKDLLPDRVDEMFRDSYKRIKNDN
ncbi:MAG: hypothetical protein LBP59_03080 [Planctomycetaceae bacterium]|jgi:hypothetical protein|nr:hypothetical protein [Planctomycetaceae bacterium]